MDAGPEEILRPTQAARRIGQSIAELAQIIWRSISEFVVSLGPHVLGGIEFRGVGREGVHTEAGMIGEESPDLAPAMDRPAIPEQVDRAAQVTQKVTEEGLDVETGEIVG